jgi:hypothetical protein
MEAAKQASSTRLPTAAIQVPHHGGKPMIDMVQDIIRARPGARGVEIVSAMQDERPDQSRKSLDRTVRTALMRLKKRQAIETRDGGWYIKEREAA